MPLIRADFALDYTQSGLLISAFTLAYGIGQLPTGWLADRFGPPAVLMIGICGVALAGVFVGLSPTYLLLLICLTLMGLLGGGYHPTASPIIAASVEEQNRGRALGLHMIGGSASYFLAPLIAAAIATVWGWRGSFIGLAIPGMAIGVVLYILIRRRMDIKEPHRKTTSSHAEAAPTPTRRARLIWFIALSTITASTMGAVISFIPLFLVDHLGTSKEVAAASVSLIYAPGLITSPLAGYLSDRWGRVPLLLAVSLVTGPVIYLFTLTPYGPFGISIGALLVFMGAVMYVRLPVSEAYIVGQSPARYRSTILGIYYFSNMEGSGVLTPILGYLIDNFGFYLTFTVVGAVQLVSTVICAIFLWGDRG